VSEAATVWSRVRHPEFHRSPASRAFLRQRRGPRAVKSAPEPANGQFEKLVRDCNQRVYRLALRITRNHQDAEDARQETFLKAYRHLDQFEGRSRFTTWISRIAINEGLMNLRKRDANRRVPLDEISEISSDNTNLLPLRRPVEDPEKSFTRRQLRGALNAAISNLRPLYRDVFILRVVEELSTSETAKALGVTVSTVKTRLRRARMELRTYLGSCGDLVNNASELSGGSVPIEASAA
jgi:RNA polymerase sigma-70 factor, ECF subfamily